MWTAVGWWAKTKVQKQLIDFHPGVYKAAKLHGKILYHIERLLKGINNAFLTVWRETYT